MTKADEHYRVLIRHIDELETHFKELSSIEAVPNIMQAPILKSMRRLNTTLINFWRKYPYTLPSIWDQAKEANHDND